MRTTIVMPAYNAEKTLERTVIDMPKVYHKIIVCDDASKDKTYEKSLALGLESYRHKKNSGYGANQKTLYEAALKDDPQIIVMVHPDNQYNTASLPQMIDLIRAGEAGLVLGSRMNSALKNKMPIWKWAGNKFLTFLQNATFGTKLSEFHSGFRAYDAQMIRKMPHREFSDDFSFDSEVIAWCRANGYTISEVSTDCFYNEDVSSISFRRSVKYGLDTLRVLYRYKRKHYTRFKIPSQPAFSLVDAAE